MVSITFTLLIILLLEGKVSFQENVTVLLSPPTRVVVPEENHSTVSCTVMSNSSLINITSVSWYDDIGSEIPAMKESANNEDYQNLTWSNETFQQSTISVFGRVKDNVFEKKYKCIANTSDPTADPLQVELQVSIQANLTVAVTQQPDSVCFKEWAVTVCDFRSHPKPRDVTWDFEMEENYTILTNQINNAVVQTSLYIFEAKMSINLTCLGSYTDYDNDTASVNKTAELVVRNDRLHNVDYFSSDGIVCVVNWNNSFIPDYTTGYQINFIGVDKTVKITSINASSTNYSWTMEENFKILFVEIALVMGRCLGPFQKSNGVCSYKSKPVVPVTVTVQDDAALIAVSVVLGCATLICFALALYLYMKDKRNIKRIAMPRSPPKNNDYQFTGNMTSRDISLPNQLQQSSNDAGPGKKGPAQSHAASDDDDGTYDDTLACNQAIYDNPAAYDLYDDNVVNAEAELTCNDPSDLNPPTRLHINHERKNNAPWTQLSSEEEIYEEPISVDQTCRRISAMPPPPDDFYEDTVVDGN